MRPPRCLLLIREELLNVSSLDKTREELIEELEELKKRYEIVKTELGKVTDLLMKYNK